MATTTNPEASKPAPPPKPAPKKKVEVRSTPEGAAVFDGDDKLGVTPLAVELPTGDQKRQLRLELDGHEDAMVALTSETAIPVVAKLTPVPTKKVRSKGKKIRKGSSKKPKKIPVW